MGTKFLFYLFGLSLFFCMSCTSTKQIAYFENASDTTFKAMIGNIEAPIQKNDILNITISSLNKTASADFNAAGDGGPQATGYLVNNDGNIQLPILGNVKAEGLTKRQLKESITNTILSKKLLIDPIINIRYMNFEVTVLGEVARPAVISVPSEKISMIKALGLAGDLTIYGKRDNVLLIREEAGQRITRHINLNSSDFLNSPYYYLQPNDVIYVEPNKTKISTAGRTQQILPLVLTGISILVLVLDRVIK